MPNGPSGHRRTGWRQPGSCWRSRGRVPKRQQIDRFLERIDQKIDAYNGKNPEVPIAYGCGIAFNEPEELTITQLVALADRRIRS